MLPNTDPISRHIPVKATPTVILHRVPDISLKAQPSIILHTTPIIASVAQTVPVHLDQKKFSCSSNRLSQTATEVPAAYRNRYASYLAALFNISLEAALAESDYQLTPRRVSDVSEADVYRA
jgi:hypothetical protein